MNNNESYFDGGLFQLIGWKILGFLVTAKWTISLAPWSMIISTYKISNFRYISIFWCNYIYNKCIYGLFHIVVALPHTPQKMTIFAGKSHYTYYFRKKQPSIFSYFISILGILSPFHNIVFYPFYSPQYIVKKSFKIL